MVPGSLYSKSGNALKTKDQEQFPLYLRDMYCVAEASFDYHRAMAESECAAYKKLKEREERAHAAWTSFLYRTKLSEKAKRKHQKEEMEAYQQAHKARLAHMKTCPTCMSNL